MKLLDIALLLAITLGSTYSQKQRPNANSGDSESSKNQDHASVGNQYFHSQYLSGPYSGLPYGYNLSDLSFANGISVPQNQGVDSIIQKLSATARVVSALSLQNGLSDGSIPVDDVIAEFLNIGSADLKGLETFDKKKVDDFVDTINGVALDKDANLLEEGLKYFYRIRMIWKDIGGSNGLNKLPDAATYKELDDVKKLDITPLTSLSLDPSITQLSNFSTLSDNDIGSLKSALSKTLSAIFKIGTSIDYSKFIGILDRLKPLRSLTEIVGFYNGKHEFRKAFLVKAEVDKTVSNLAKLKPLTSTSESDSYVNSMNSIITSRLYHNSMVRRYTAGFMNGFKDLEMLSKDVKDQWLLTQINPSIDIKGVESLVQLKSPMADLEKKWSEVSTENVYSSVKRLAYARSLLNSQTTNVMTKDNLEIMLESIQNCKKANKEDGVTDKLKLISTNVEVLNRKLSTLNSICSSAKKNQMEQSINSLSKKTSPDNVRSILQFFQGLKSQINIVTSGPAFKDINMMSSDTSFVTDFLSNGYTKPYVESFDALQKLGVEFEEVAQAAMASIEIREIKNDANLLKNVKSVTTSLSESSGHLAALRKLVASLKGDEKGGKNEQLKDLPKLSKSFGEAVNALVLAKKTSEQDAELKLFAKNGIAIESGAETANNPPFFEKFKKQWGDFDETTSEIISTQIRSGEWISKMKVAESPKLLDFATIFTGLETINDVDLKSNSRLSAIALFGTIPPVPELKDVLPEFKKSLLTLSKLDLKFSRFHSSVNQMPDTLKQLSVVLGSSPSGATTVPPAMVAKDESDSDMIMAMIVGGGVFGFCIICVIAVYIVLFCKRNDKKWKIWWDRMTCGCFKKNTNNKTVTARAKKLPDPHPLRDEQKKVDDKKKRKESKLTPLDEVSARELDNKEVPDKVTKEADKTNGAAKKSGSKGVKKVTEKTAKAPTKKTVRPVAPPVDNDVMPPPVGPAESEREPSYAFQVPLPYDQPEHDYRPQHEGCIDGPDDTKDDASSEVFDKSKRAPGGLDPRSWLPAFYRWLRSRFSRTESSSSSTTNETETTRTRVSSPIILADDSRTSERPTSVHSTRRSYVNEPIDFIDFDFNEDDDESRVVDDDAPSNASFYDDYYETDDDEGDKNVSSNDVESNDDESSGTSLYDVNADQPSSVYSTNPESARSSTGAEEPRRSSFGGFFNWLKFW
ncbi:hypothetical protein CRE_02978 [Caenorhabditis remanei]|uniref:Domain of unknown function WSN domain-containing protein n=1 Tax=Caenorhabditis remanei TaxID=31234 RepID=E3LX13_CAERE|nr:hypothetical protein CRE_02978 [Caenorhabditis remanei]